MADNVDMDGCIHFEVEGVQYLEDSTIFTDAHVGIFHDIADGIRSKRCAQIDRELSRSGWSREIGSAAQYREPACLHADAWSVLEADVWASYTE